MNILEVVGQIISFFVSLATILKTSVEAKKLLEERVMPDIKASDKAEEIRRKQELSSFLLKLAGIEAIYNIARGLVILLFLHTLVCHAYKLMTFLRGRE